MQALWNGQAGTVAYSTDKHERLRVLVRLEACRACPPRGPNSKPHACREGEMVGIGVSLVRRIAARFEYWTGSTCNFPQVKKRFGALRPENFARLEV